MIIPDLRVIGRDDIKVFDIIALESGSLRSINEEYLFCKNSSLPYVTESELVILLIGEVSYWKSDVEVALVLSKAPLSKVAGLKRLGISDRRGIVDIKKVAGIADQDPDTDTAPYGCGKLTVCYRLAPIPEDSDSDEDSLRLKLQIVTFLRWCGIGRSNRFTLTEATCRKVLGAPKGRLSALRYAMDTAREFNALLEEATAPQFAAQANELALHEANAEGSLVDDHAHTIFTSGKLIRQACEYLAQVRDHKASSYYLPMSEFIHKELSRPDKLWLDSLRNLEELSRSINWKKRPNQEERNNRATVRAGRACSLGAYKTRLSASPIFIRAKILSGNDASAELGWLIAILGEFSSRMLTRVNGYSLAEVLGVMKTLAAQSAPEVSKEAIECLEAFADSKSADILAIFESADSAGWLKNSDHAHQILSIVRDLEASGYPCATIRSKVAQFAEMLEVPDFFSMEDEHIALLLP